MNNRNSTFNRRRQCKSREKLGLDGDCGGIYVLKGVMIVLASGYCQRASVLRVS